MAKDSALSHFVEFVEDAKAARSLNRFTTFSIVTIGIFYLHEGETRYTQILEMQSRSPLGLNRFGQRVSFRFSPFLRVALLFDPPLYLPFTIALVVCKHPQLNQGV